MAVRGRQFVWADTGSIRIMVHGEGAPNEEEWQRFMRETVKEVAGKLVAPERRAAVIYSLGGMASAAQRRQLERLSVGDGPRPQLVLMTNSRLARGGATALGWIVPALRNFRAFSLNQLDEAALELCPHPAERAEFKRILEGLLLQLSGTVPLRTGTEISG